MAKPKILFLDIETLPNKVYSWGLKVDGWLPPDNIVQERHIVSVAWKWLGKKKVYAATASLAPHLKGALPDAALLRQVSRVLNEADAVVTHNGNYFDLPWIRARMVINGMKPHRPIISIDTKTIASRHFYFNSNKLDYLGKILKLGQKIHTDFGLWVRVEQGDKAALREMVRYNKEDVRLLQRLFIRLRPYIASQINAALFEPSEMLRTRVCPTCGKPRLVISRPAYTRTREVIRMRCKACGAFCTADNGKRLPR
jgi:hypothetical protein